MAAESFEYVDRKFYLLLCAAADLFNVLSEAPAATVKINIVNRRRRSRNAFPIWFIFSNFVRKFSTDDDAGPMNNNTR